MVLARICLHVIITVSRVSFLAYLFVSFSALWMVFKGKKTPKLFKVDMANSCIRIFRQETTCFGFPAEFKSNIHSLVALFLDSAHF